MGSLEEMVHDFIEPAESPAPIFSMSSQHPPLNHSTTQYVILQEILGSGRDGEIEIVKCVLKHLKRNMEAEDSSSLRKWLVKTLTMDGHHASLCHTSWVNTFTCPGGDYEYIDVMMKDGNGGSLRRVIVDIDFKSQFEVARPTSTYKELSETLPTIFVGDEQKLHKIISILCSAAKESLEERGLHMPPWRTSTYMHSKWLSQCPTTKYEWTPLVLKPKKKRELGARSALSSQFPNFTTKCC